MSGLTHSRFAALILVGAAGLTTACGESAQDDGAKATTGDPREVVREFLDGLAHGDTSVCELMSDSERSRLALAAKIADTGSSCESYLAFQSKTSDRSRKKDLADAADAVGSARLDEYESSAVITLDAEGVAPSQVFLNKSSGAWKIDDTE